MIFLFDGSSAPPVQEEHTAATLCFDDVSVLHSQVRAAAHWWGGATCRRFGEQGLVAVNVGRAGERKIKETGTEGSRGTEGQQSIPSGGESSYGCKQQRTSHSTGPAASE